MPDVGCIDYRRVRTPAARRATRRGEAPHGAPVPAIRLRRDRLLAAANEEAAEARDAVALVSRLQHSLLTDPPPVPGLDMAVRYAPAVRRAQVGGDWYDAFPLPDGATMLVIGDVAGHDVAAAATMAEARGVLRGIAQSRAGTPADVLAALDDALGRLGDDTLITAVVATVSRRPDGALLCWSDAGHPPPLLMTADGDAVVLERAADPLLRVGSATRTTTRCTCAPGTRCCSTPTGWSSGAASRSTRASPGWPPPCPRSPSG